jgi:hypothetical protein
MVKMMHKNLCDYAYLMHQWDLNEALKRFSRGLGLTRFAPHIFRSQCLLAGSHDPPPLGLAPRSEVATGYGWSATATACA